MPESADIPSLTWVDGEQSTLLPLPDRGLQFGDGLFETFLLSRGHAVFADLHFARLARGLGILEFPQCMDRVREQLAQVEAAVTQAGWSWTALRLTVTRGGGPRGYAPADDCRPRLVATATRLDRDCRECMPPARLVPSSIELGAQPLLAGLKHLNRLEQVLAANEARKAGADEALVNGPRGTVSCVSAGNIFAVVGSRLLTPPVTLCGIAGTRREKILADWAPALGLEVEERALGVADIERADELFYSNSLVGLRPVGALGSVSWSVHTACEKLFAAYLGELA